MKESTPPKQQSQGVQEPGSLITIMTEGFEGAFPSANWSIYGSPSWDGDDCKPHTGYRSAWCARAGGQDPCPFTDYPNNMGAWMIYGPFNLADAKAAELSFWYWLRSEQTYDRFWWTASSDSVNFYGRVPMTSISMMAITEQLHIRVAAISDRRRPMASIELNL